MYSNDMRKWGEVGDKESEGLSVWAKNLQLLVGEKTTGGCGWRRGTAVKRRAAVEFARVTQYRD